MRAIASATLAWGLLAGAPSSAAEAASTERVLDPVMARIEEDLAEIAAALQRLVTYQEHDLLLREAELEQRRLEPRRRELDDLRREMRSLELERTAQAARLEVAVEAGQLTGDEELQMRDELARWRKEIGVRLEALSERAKELEAELRLESQDLEELRRELRDRRRDL